MIVFGLVSVVGALIGFGLWMARLEAADRPRDGDTADGGHFVDGRWVDRTPSSEPRYMDSKEFLVDQILDIVERTRGPRRSKGPRPPSIFDADPAAPPEQAKGEEP